MTKEEYKSKIALIDQESDNKKLELMKEYVRSNNPYKAGDIVTDHIGSLKIEKMTYSWGYGNPDAVFSGIELKKDGTPMKKQSGRSVYQSNIINS